MPRRHPSIAGSAPGTHPSPPGTHPRRARQPSHSRRSLPKPPAEQRIADKELRPTSSLPPGRLFTAENQTKQSQAPPFLPRFLGRMSPAPPGQRLCSPAGTRQNRGEHPDKEGEASGDGRDKTGREPRLFQRRGPCRAGRRGGTPPPPPVRRAKGPEAGEWMGVVVAQTPLKVAQKPGTVASS